LAWWEDYKRRGVEGEGETESFEFLSMTKDFLVYANKVLLSSKLRKGVQSDF